ncbi:hypothetical protein ES288_D08G116500v1 [Gossypium darwinii]|uniref:Uncharacterized protein n=1 Tax=Gossypium darwinii TaxID=34276 RepID=A0A5D2BNK2_GOSDA|nr:hypothetical protein ES288_D08G116500v1 [Gossypium darwinii]
MSVFTPTNYMIITSSNRDNTSSNPSESCLKSPTSSPEFDFTATDRGVNPKLDLRSPENLGDDLKALKDYTYRIRNLHKFSAFDITDSRLGLGWKASRRRCW